MAGIVFGWLCSVDTLHILLLFAVAAVAMAVGLWRSAPRPLFGVAAMAAMFAIGLYVHQCEAAEKEGRWSDERQLYTARLLEVPVTGGKSLKVLASVTQSADTLVCRRSSGDVYLYFPRSVESDALQIGDIISFEGKVMAPRNLGNPAEFDIERHYYIKGITGTAYLAGDSWEVVGDAPLTLPMHALVLRDSVERIYRRLGFDDDEFALLSAITVGDKSDLSQELKENYSSAGVSHILALSGLHLGLIYAILVFLFPLRSRRRTLIVAREGVVVLSLWGFAFVAGLSPSVVRAALLFSLMSLGRCLSRENSSLSSLAFAALAMLLYSPHLLFDISFQLSFAAVFSIVVLAPPLQNLLKCHEHGKLYNYIANLLILSVAAQLGTLPFVWYYFGEFPLYFLFANLLLVPLTFVVIAVAIVVLLLSFVPVVQQPVSSLLGVLLSAMNNATEFVSSLPGSAISLPEIGAVGGFCAAFVIVALLIGLFRKKWWLVTISMVCALLFTVVMAVQDKPASSGDRVVVYNNRTNPLLHAVDTSGCNWLVSTVPQLDAEYEYSSRPYIEREGLPAPQWAWWNHSSGALSLKEGLLSFAGLKIRLVDNSYWQENEYVEPADVVLLCRGFLGSIDELLEVYPTNCLLLDASLYKHSRERILRECVALGVDAVDISRTGAVMIVPDGDTFVVEPLRGK